MRISVVTPTLNRPDEVRDLLTNLGEQTVLPSELVLIDAAAPGDDRTSDIVANDAPDLPYLVQYIRRGGGTAIQRNVGIDAAHGEFIAFVDDDIRLEPNFFAHMIEVFEQDDKMRVGGVTGYITNQHLDPETSRRWRWYRRLRLFTTFEPGHYDFETGYPINRYLQPPHEDLREVDFMGAGCAVWRREVFADGLRFHEFFTGHGVLEDAHLALRAGRTWRLLENGRARCIHLRCRTGRSEGRRLGELSATNYRFVFVDIVRRRTWRQERRFWTVQLVDLLRFLAQLVRHPHRDSAALVWGKMVGMAKASRICSEGTP